MEPKKQTATETKSDAPQPAQEGERTFTQTQVNDIVTRRLAKERERLQALAANDGADAHLAEREGELARRELKITAQERLQQAGLPLAAADLLRYESEGAFEESFSQMQRLLGPGMQQAVEKVFRTRGRYPVPTQDSTSVLEHNVRAAFKPT